MRGMPQRRLKIGNLNLEQFRDASLALQQPEIWKKVRDRIGGGTMPPATGQPLPPAAETRGGSSAGSTGCSAARRRRASIPAGSRRGA